MKKLLIAATSATLLFTGQAFAQSSDAQDITLNGEVAPTCVVGDTSNPAGNTIDFGATLANPATAEAVVTTQTIAYASSYCNAAYRVQLESQNGGITTNTTTPTGFTNVVEYTATALLNGNATSEAELDTSTANSDTSAPSGQADFGNLEISVETQAGTEPLIAANDYTDVLTVTLTPQ